MNLFKVEFKRLDADAEIIFSAVAISLDGDVAKFKDMRGSTLEYKLSNMKNLKITQLS